jgi:hypothetical protein
MSIKSAIIFKSEKRLAWIADRGIIKGKPVPIEIMAFLSNTNLDK